MEQNVSSLCNKNFSQQIPIRYKTELSTLAASINHLGDTIQLLLLTEDAKLKQKEQFVKSIAHDIRTPLTVVIGYLELLQRATQAVRRAPSCSSTGRWKRPTTSAVSPTISSPSRRIAAPCRWIPTTGRSCCGR